MMHAAGMGALKKLNRDASLSLVERTIAQPPVPPRRAASPSNLSADLSAFAQRGAKEGTKAEQAQAAGEQEARQWQRGSSRSASCRQCWLRTRRLRAPSAHGAGDREAAGGSSSEEEGYGPSGGAAGVRAAAPAAVAASAGDKIARWGVGGR
ncbi:hypothetical protein CLOP_g1816 [Closterium sp. NIES-67]|nr:hypothetical protein CLOP_g1816 [Closterium sp. NIES-67]